MSTKSDIEDGLKKQGILFEPGKGGVMVSEVDDAFILQNMSKDLENRQFTKTQVKGILQAFPKLAVEQLERFLVSNTESSRRAVMLRERLNSEIYTNVMSLDPERPMPPLDAVDARNPKNIPRLYSALDMTDPKRRTLVLWGSELPAPRNAVRLDEAMFMIDIDNRSAERIRAGEDPRKVLKGKSVSNARILYYDDNKIVTGKSRLEHHLKSLDSLESWLHKALGELNCVIKGEIFVHVEDDFVDSPVARMKNNQVDVDRLKPGGRSKLTSQRFFLSLTWKAHFKNGVLQSLKPIRNSRASLFIENISRKDIQTILRRLARLGKQVEQTLIAASKNTRP